MAVALKLKTLVDQQSQALRGLVFSSPVTHVYNPLDYAREPFLRYLERFGKSPKEVLLVGMNPGPWGMIQTGVPFGEIEAVTGWMGIDGRVGQPDDLHPKRPVEGMACRRREVSGKRLWGWARDRFGSPENFFKRFLVLNYCPLAFFDRDGKNLTPDKLPTTSRKPLLEACDRSLREWAAHYRPHHVIGVGRFAALRIQTALDGLDCAGGQITHPSPANPRANQGWAQCIERELEAMGITL